MKKFLIIFGIIFATLALLAAILISWFATTQNKKPEIIGVTFSQKQAERFGVDWKQNYLALLDDLGFKHLRLIAYWDRIEPQKDKFDFSEIDFLLDEANKRNAKVTLTIGQKLPRFPECYYPAWLDRHNPQDTKARANKMIREVVSRYKNHPALEGWQLENEFLLKSYGRCPSNNLTNKQLADELEIIKSVDKSHPVMLTQSDEAGWPFIGPFADQFGFSMYKRVWWDYLGYKGYFKYPQPGIYNLFKAAVIKFYSGQEPRVHELQAEAWGPDGNESISLEEMNKTMSPQYFDESIKYARDSKIRWFDLWGAEWWYWLKTKKDRPEMWEKVRSLLENSNQQ